MRRSRKKTGPVVALLLLVVASATAQVETPMQLLQQLDEFPHAQQIEYAQAQVLDYEVGLGAMQKRGGAWQFKNSERYNGTLTDYTWQIIDGFTSREVMESLLTQVGAIDSAQLLFSCDGRACGKGVQWANRVFGQPVLYGRDDMQRYRVYTLGEASEYLLLMWAAARTADRQYLHVELLQVDTPVD